MRMPVLYNHKGVGNQRKKRDGASWGGAVDSGQWALGTVGSGLSAKLTITVVSRTPPNFDQSRNIKVNLSPKLPKAAKGERASKIAKNHPNGPKAAFPLGARFRTVQQENSVRIFRGLAVRGPKGPGVTK